MSLALVQELLAAHRHDSDWLVDRAQAQAQRIWDLQQANAALTAQCQEHLERLGQVQQQVAELHERLQEAERAAKRQSAPFRRSDEKRKKKLKKPGRKPGHAGSHRERPDHVDQEQEVKLDGCAQCGCDEAVQVREMVQYIEEIPPVRPVVTKLVTYTGECAQCGQTMESDHPLKVSNATGAAGTHLGPRALAVAAELNKHRGLSLRKTCDLLETLFGLRLTSGGLAQALQRVGSKLEPNDQALLEDLRQSPVAYGDETSWWMGGSAWLWVFTTPTLTC